ncbi:MAG: hypothetical protein ABIO70_36765 [Pseudomonadota bacterium]
MRALLLLIALPLLAVRCTPTGDLGPVDDSGDTHTDDTQADDTASMGPCESGFCELTVTAAEATCRQPDEPEGGLEVTSPAAGTLEVVHYAVQTGCCPTLTVFALQDLRHDSIDVTYEVSGDDCQCACQLDFRYTLADAQPGSFTLQAEGASAEVTVE